MIGFYFDEHMSRVVANTLVKQGIDVIMAVDVGMIGKDDDTEHLPYAIEHQLVLVTFDQPFANRAAKRFDHPGVVKLSYTINDDIGEIRQLSEFAQLYDTERDAGMVYWLP